MMTPLRYIRKVIFGLNQAEFADVVGRTQATVSRWESGTAPSLDDMRSIRDAAVVRGIVWNDAWFFDIPSEAAEAIALAHGEGAAATDIDDFDAALPRPNARGAGAGPASQAGAGLPLQTIQETAE